MMEDKVDTYTRLKAADALDSAAKNEGNGGINLAAMGVGLGAGSTLGNVFAQSMAPAAAPAAPAAVPTRACANCGSTMPASAKFCPECGTKVATKAFCTNCGAEVGANAKFCSECGTKIGG